jgi:hypothetical protein
MVFGLFIFDTGIKVFYRLKVLKSSPGKSFTPGNLRKFQMKQCPLVAMSVGRKIYINFRQMMKKLF